MILVIIINKYGIYTQAFLYIKYLIPISRQGLLVTLASFILFLMGRRFSSRGDLGLYGMQRYLGSALSHQEGSALPAYSTPGAHNTPNNVQDGKEKTIQLIL